MGRFFFSRGDCTNIFSYCQRVRTKRNPYLPYLVLLLAALATSLHKHRTDNEKKELKPFLGTKMECVHVWFVHLCHYLIDSWTSSCILHTSKPSMEWTKHETAYLTLKSMFLQKRTSKVNLHSISHTFNRITWFLVFCLLNSRKTHLKESFS